MKKTSRTFKRFAAITSASLLAACMVAPMSMNVSAFNVTIKSSSDGTADGTNNDDGIHTYAAYQIFKGTYTDGVLSNVEWGDSITTEGLITELKKETAFSGLSADADAEDVADILSTFDNKSSDAEAFAKFIANYVTTPLKTSNANGVIEELDNGYYLIQDNGNPGSGEDNSGAKTKFVLAVLGKDTTVYTKTDAPSVEKKVFEEEYEGNEYGTGFNDVADHEIGEEIDFKLIGSLPSTLSDYDKYYYKFTDTYASTLDTIDGNADGKVDVVVKFYNPNNGVYDFTTDGTVIEPVNYEVLESGNSFTVEFEDIKSISGITSASKIVVEYKAKLTSQAVIGLSGQRNDVKLTYSNNPNAEGAGTNSDRGETPIDEVIVYTYELDIDKVNTDITTSTTKEQFNGAKLKGAEFILYKNVTENDTTKTYAAVLEGNVVKEWVEGSFNDEKTAFTAVGTTPATILSSGDENNSEAAYQTIKIKGLEAGTYYLQETKEPKGYNRIEDPKELVIAATKTTTQTWNGTGDLLTSLTLNGKDALAVDDSLGRNGEEFDKGLVWAGIVNKAGTTLPGTGGIGTTVFYLGGGAMVAVAGIYLISKKRMKNTQE